MKNCLPLAWCTTVADLEYHTQTTVALEMYLIACHVARRMSVIDVSVVHTAL